MSKTDTPAKDLAPTPEVVTPPVEDLAPTIDEPYRAVRIGFALASVAAEDGGEVGAGGMPVRVSVDFNFSLPPGTPDEAIMPTIAQFLGGLGSGLEDAAVEGLHLPSQWASPVRDAVRELRATDAYLRNLVAEIR
jgi:hypothetical protein